MSLRRRREMTPTRVLSIVVAAFAAAVSGCGSGDDDAAASADSSEGSPKAVLEYPSELSSSSSPSDVARVLVRALDEKDGKTLAGLVAAKAEAEAVNAIFAKRGRSANTRPEAAAAFVAGGWRTSYAIFKKGETKVTSEDVKGNEATVYAAGVLRVGEPRRLKIEMIREDGLWKVRAGLNTLPAKP